MPITTPTKTKNVFTRITLDPVSMQAVQKIQAILPNYDLNDAVKMLLGIGVKNVDNVMPLFDANGFDSLTKSKLLMAKQELDLNNGKTFDNPQDAINYAKSTS
jgi:hypothetical protein